MNNENPSNVTELNENTLAKLKRNRKVQRIAVIGGLILATAVAFKAGTSLASTDQEENSEN